MTDLEKQMAEALRGLLNDTQHASHDDCDDGPCPVREAREALAKLDAQAAEQAAGGGEAVNGTTTGEINGRHDRIRPAVHGRVALGGYTPGALADLLFASDDVMSLNAKLDLTMDQLVPLAQAVLSAISIHPAKAAPSDPQPKGAAHNGSDKEPRDPDSYPYLDARGDDRGQGLDSYWKWGYSAGWNDHKKHATNAPAPAESPAAPVQPVGELDAFEAWFSQFRHGWKTERDVARDAWQAALSTRPELNDEAPPLKANK